MFINEINLHDGVKPYLVEGEHILSGNVMSQKNTTIGKREIRSKIFNCFFIAYSLFIPLFWKTKTALALILKDYFGHYYDITFVIIMTLLLSLL